MRILLLLLLPIFSFSQEIATTSSGKKVKLNSNGTWEYVQTVKKENLDFKCEDVVETTVDKMTGKSSIATKDFISIGDKEKGFDVIMLITSNSLVFSVGVNGKVGCIDEKDKMNVLFRDGTRIELLHNSKFNCKGDFTVYFSKAFRTLDNLEQFKSKEVETIRVWGSSGFVEKDLTQEESKKLKKAFECLADKM